MINFTKRSLLRIIILTVCTLGIYCLYWSVVTKRELEKAGGDLPNAILIFIPFVNLYFWYRYAQAYTKIVKKDQNATEVNLNFLVAVLPQISGFFLDRHDYAAIQQHGNKLNNFIQDYPKVAPAIKANFAKLALITTTAAIVLLCSVVMFSLIIFKMAYFQKGYNNYQN